MEKILKSGFLAVQHSISFNPQGLKKGITLANSHVVRVEERQSPDLAINIIHGYVIRQTSVTLPPYKVELLITNDRHVVQADCTCVSKEGHKCKHISALIHFINVDRSSTKTSIEQEWGKPSASQLGKEKYAKPIVVTEHFHSKKEVQHIDVCPYDNLDLDDFPSHPCALQVYLIHKNKVEKEGPSEKTVSLKEKAKTEEDIIRVCVENLLLHFKENDVYDKPLTLTDQTLKLFYEKKVQLSESDVIELCLSTRFQSQCQKWFDNRLLRISASSKAHSIKIRKKNDLSKLLKSFMSTNSIKTTPMKYGNAREPIALEIYKKEYNVQLIKIGLLVCSSQPWLSASPDSIVVKDGCINKLVEIKCPYNCLNLPIFNEETETFNVPYLSYINEIIILNENHKYYTQCQVQMYVCGLSQCDLFVYSPVQCCLVEVDRDDLFLQNLIPKLQDFYFNNYLPYIVQSDKENISL